MLQAATPTCTLGTRLLNSDGTAMADTSNREDDTVGSDEDLDEGGKGNSRSKSRRELPAGAVATLKAWLLSPEHFTHPYPTPQDQVMLMQKTGIDKKQLKNWFTNARRRIWKPMLKKQLEQGKLTATGAGGGGVAVPGVVPGLMVPQMSGGMVGQADQDTSNSSVMRVHYQQAVQHSHGQAPQQQQHGQPQQQQQQQQEVQHDAYGNPLYVQQGAAPQLSGAPAPVASSQQQYYDQQGVPSGGQPSMSGALTMSTSIGSLRSMTPTASGQQMSKTDSHAVLMELFARDQDLVRQATESAAGATSAARQGQSQEMHTGQQLHGQQMGQGMGALSHPGQPQQISSQHPMKTPSQGRLMNVPTLNSWPHFSSISSLNNLGTMPGVKSIASLSGADLANQGPVNRVGNLAQVKSVESMGKNDSYAFLEVFFGDRSSTALSSGMGTKDQRGVKRERDDDNENVGLSLEDESPSIKQEPVDDSSNVGSNNDLNPTPFMSSGGKDANDGTGTLKRAYDDALAARGLISVSRSCEKLTDLALPAKMQRTLSQEYLRQQQAAQSSQYGQYQYTSAPPTTSDQNDSNRNDSQQYPGQHPGQQMQQHQGGGDQKSNSIVSDPNNANASVEVPSATKCALCHQTNVDTQLRPCGHMFHERCLKPSLQAPMGPPKCPVDHIPMISALLAVPTDEARPVSAPMPPQPASWNPSLTRGMSRSSHGQTISSDSQRSDS